VSGQLHAQAALSPGEKNAPIYLLNERIKRELLYNSIFSNMARMRIIVVVLDKLCLNNKLFIEENKTATVILTYVSCYKSKQNITE
jgi:hypothetical protein